MVLKLNQSLRSFALAAGGLRVMREIGRGGVRIILYHRFPAAMRESLERQCAHLRRHYNLVSLSDVHAWLAGKRRLKANSLAVTVDDGYRDFYLTAYPVFSSYRIPVTVFLASDFLDRKCWLWGDRIEYAFQATPLRQVELPLPGGEWKVFSFGSGEQRRQAAAILKNASKKVSNAAKLQFIYEELPERLKVRFPAEPPEESAPLDWNEVREMAAAGIDFGAHTKTHPILSSLGTAAELSDEIIGSKRRLEEELAKPVLHFSYPNGTWPDLNPDTVETVKRAGFHTAVIAQGGVNYRAADPFLLRRNTVEPQIPEGVFGKYATGFGRS